MKKTSRFTRAEIKQFLATAKRVLRVPGLDFLIAPTATGQGRLLIITPARIGTAPQRNTVRRRLKAIFQRSNVGAYEYDCGVIVKIQGVNLSSAELEHYLIKALTKMQTHDNKRSTPA